MRLVLNVNSMRIGIGELEQEFNVLNYLSSYEFVIHVHAIALEIIKFVNNIRFVYNTVHHMHACRLYLSRNIRIMIDTLKFILLDHIGNVLF